MKKIVMIALVAAFFTSCKKDYTCKCNTNTDWSDGTHQSSQTTFTSKQSKKNADDWCHTYQSSSNSSSGGLTITTNTLCNLQ